MASGVRNHTADSTQIALLLGAVIGEGFIAVEARDAAEVKEAGSAVLTLARGRCSADGDEAQPKHRGACRQERLVGRP